ncbi:MAG: hypothetical protein GOV00_00395 [Candidatus Altiarchaeota archaeon]|nr:hypothetical protein [Candidatus Altiarchaeota archaeon]
MVALTAILAGVVGSALSFLVQAVTATLSLLVSVVQFYIAYFSFIINLTRRTN